MTVKKESFKNVLLAVLFCSLGSLFVAFALNQVLKPAGFSPGGVTGLAVLLNKLTHNKVPVGVGQLVMNIPLFIWSISSCFMPQPSSVMMILSFSSFFLK